MLVIVRVQEFFPHRGDDPQKDVGDHKKHDPAPNGGRPTKRLNHTCEDEIGGHDAKCGHHVKCARQRGALTPFVKARGDVVGEQRRGVHQKDD